ncbi:PE-PGRS family protein [Streptomyces sp. NPDC001020]
MRNVNPDDLDQLAKLLDGKGGLTDKLNEAFIRASALGVSDKLTAIKPMQAWARDNPSDMRKRAAIIREDELFKRGDRETYSDWLARIESHYLAKIPGLKEVGEKDIETFLNNVSDVTGVLKIGGVTLLSGTAMGKVLLQNSWYNGALRTAVDSSWWARGGAFRARLGGVLSRIPAGQLRSLSAPGSWLPGQLGNMFSGSRLYQNASQIPFMASRRAAWLGQGWDAFRTLPLVRSPLVTKGINFMVGSDALAMRYGGATHSGALVSRAGQASLYKVFRSASYFQKINNARPAVIAAGKTASPLLKGLGTASKAGGFLRVAGVGASAVATGVSIANVAAQGNPVEAFKKKGAGYVADVAEVGFNASLTAAMVAPNPVTIGLAVGTGLVYGGAKVVEHWDDIKAGTGKAVDWVGDKASKVGKGIANGAKSVAKKANPMNWF